MSFTDEELNGLLTLKEKLGNVRALVMPALWILQRKQGFISDSDCLYLEKTLGINAIHFAEAISFFCMYNDKKPAKYELKFCKTISCKLRGSDEIIKIAEKILGIKMGETTSDGLISLGHTECLGYCEKAPCMLCNLEQIDTLDEEKISSLIKRLRK